MSQASRVAAGVGPLACKARSHEIVSVAVITRRTQRARDLPVLLGGVTGLTAVVLLVGVVVARFTTSTRPSAVAVVAGVTLGGALIGGFLAAPRISPRHEPDVGAPAHDEESSRSR
jgi:hypothetical protein